MTDIIGTSGDDVLSGDAENDAITGLEGNDILAGLDGNDDLNGGPGNDVMVGGRGSDTVAGEAGSDTIIWNNGDGSDTMDGGADTDTQEVNGAVAAGDEFQVDAGADGAAVFQRVNLVPFTLNHAGSRDPGRPGPRRRRPVHRRQLGRDRHRPERRLAGG